VHALGLKVALDTRITDQKFIMYMPWSFEKVKEIHQRILAGEIPERTGGMITSPSNYDPGLAPQGKQLIFFGTACLPHQDWELWGTRCVEAFLEVFPEAKGHILWHRLDTPDDIDRYAGEGGNVIGVGQTINQIADRRPSVKTPIPGLYLSSAEAGGHGIGAELAASSALEVVDMILGEDRRES
jgi:phytoene dehydrogenase-like protein